MFFIQISTAIKFLQNPKVQQSPVSQRKAFLERKGRIINEKFSYRRKVRLEGRIDLNKK